MRVTAHCAIVYHMQTDELLTTPQVALILGKSHRSVHRLAQSGELPVAQRLPGPNGAILYRTEDVERIRRDMKADAR